MSHSMLAVSFLGMLATTNEQAHANTYVNYSNRYQPLYSGRTSHNTLYTPSLTNFSRNYSSFGNYGLNTFSRYNAYNYNNWNVLSNYGYTNRNNNSRNNYGYTNWNSYSNNLYGLNMWNLLGGLSANSNYIYRDGNYYYRMNDGTYRVYRNGQWVSTTPTRNNSNSNSNTLTTDRHYRYVNGYHYYVLDNGDYYYYENGQWKFVKASVETPSTNERPRTETPSTNETPRPETPVTENPTSVTPQPDVTPTPEPTVPVEPSRPTETVTSTEEPARNPFAHLDQGASREEEPSESLPVFEPQPETPSLDRLDYAPDASIDYDKLPKPTLPPTDPKMKKDPRFVSSNGTYYYYVALTREERARGIDGYYLWDGKQWKLHNGTDATDSALRPENHVHTKDDEYTYDDIASSHKNFSENVIATGKVGEALPFKNLEEFKAYVEKQAKPVFKDISGWDAKVTWSIEDESAVETYKDYAFARDYVLVADLKSGVDQDDYRDRELGYVKFIYRVEASAEPDYVALDAAKVAFEQINAERQANGLAALTWSEDVYQSTSLPKAQEIARQYSSDGIVERRETDGKVVAKKWLNSGVRDLLLSPDAKEASVAVVIAGDGTYYWTYNYR